MVPTYKGYKGTLVTLDKSAFKYVVKDKELPDCQWNTSKTIIWAL